MLCSHEPVTAEDPRMASPVYKPAVDSSSSDNLSARVAGPGRMWGNRGRRWCPTMAPIQGVEEGAVMREVIRVLNVLANTAALGKEVEVATQPPGGTGEGNSVGNEVVLTLAELLWDQLKARQKSSIRNGSQIQCPSSSQTMEDLISFLGEKSLRDIDIFVCVLVHNIDGPGLRDCESQQCLAQIACCSGVRMIASIDHINAPLLWDKKMVHKQFNWCWYHVPTFVPYKVEGVFFPLILASGSTAQNAKTALIVLQSLTPNAQSVFKALAEYQLAHPKEEGMPMNALYSICRERFLVSSQVTLNSHLVEFKDHDLVKIRRNSEGQDCYYVPLSPEGLEKLLQELN